MYFEAPQKVIQLLAKYPNPWCIAGGWSIDYFLGQETRPHEDVEIMVFRLDQLALQAYMKDWPLRKVQSHGDGTATVVPWETGEWLSLPIHQIRSFPHNGVPEFDFMLNECIEASWAYRRNLQVTRPIAQTIRHTSDGVPYLSPEVALLYKAHNNREKDQHDFHLVHRKLDVESRTWLINALEACNPRHAWIDLLKAIKS